MRLLILELSDRCDQRCAHCSIWEGAGAHPASLTLTERLKVVDDALAAGAHEALLTGGEPLLSPDLWPVAARLRAGGARVMLATNGLRLERHAEEVARLVDEVYVSLDGADAATHDGLRGTASFARVIGGIDALRRLAPRPRIVIRSTVHAGNADQLAHTVDTARRSGADHVSFLPLDAHSSAFGGRPVDRRALVPSAEQVRHLYAIVDRLDSDGQLKDGFVLESAAKLRRMIAHLAASGGERGFDRPACDAPQWSSVVTSAGELRPCFFHAPVGDVRRGLVSMRRSPVYRAALAQIAAPNDTCARCVCPKRRGPAWRELFR
jgi:MoaA/NifB/PqqE/SkfB family radical SAM enzyme